MKKYNLAFIDVETTGFDPINQEILEIGCVLAKQVPANGRGATLEIVDEFDYKIKPENLAAADPEALRINGYNEMEWMFAPSLTQVMEQFADKTEGAMMVAHNLTFDWQFIEQAFKKTGIKNKMHYGKLDTISIAFAKLYHLEAIQRFNLASLAEYFGIQNAKAHTALADARTTFEVYKKLIEL
jgi:DNA polymerase III epsilon subunit family exonuclease